ncbi:hypothetical protein IWW40_002932 [Coemansia sp. RSA 1250]|nr:hypothetical protein IWW40_002932 [Coemansia sp. RSA 1250]
MLAFAAHAHTHIRNIIIDGKALDREECIRPYESNFNFPVKGVNNRQLVCRTTSMSPSKTNTCDVKAGSTMVIEFHEEMERSSRAIEGKHYGPCLAYLSKMNSDGSPEGWFKIFEQGYDSSKKRWCIDDLNDNDGQLEITIPGDLQDGNYLLRGEIIALHLAEKKGGAEFYNNCVQLRITGGTGSASPELFQIPGIYKEDDPGIHFNLYDGYSSYNIPGPKLYMPGSTPANVSNKTTNPNEPVESSPVKNDPEDKDPEDKDPEDKDPEDKGPEDNDPVTSPDTEGKSNKPVKSNCTRNRKRRLMRKRRNFNVRRTKKEL